MLHIIAEYKRYCLMHVHGFDFKNLIYQEKIIVIVDSLSRNKLSLKLIIPLVVCDAKLIALTLFEFKLKGKRLQPLLMKT